MSVFGNKKIGSMSLLLAEPFMKDANFARSVVLLVDVEDGVVGFVINDDLNGDTVSSVIDDWVGDNFDLYIGGPVEQNSLHFIHKYKDLEGSIALSEELYWGGDFEQLKEWNKLGKLDAENIKFFLGYAGWTKQQLKDELEQKSWIILPLGIDVFTQHTVDMWKEILENKGGEYKEIANYPIDPQLN